jgi:hypothetical protein
LTLEQSSTQRPYASGAEAFFAIRIADNAKPFEALPAVSRVNRLHQIELSMSFNRNMTP